MQNKPLVFGLLGGAVALWLLLSWNPVAREELEDDAVTQPDTVPSAAPAAPSAEAPPAERPQPAEQPAPELEHPPEEAAEAAPVEQSTGIKLVHAPKQDVDMANLPPPSASGPLQELQKEFESAARDSSSSELEAKIEEAFKLQHVPPELLESAVCHGSTCRVRTRWTSARAGGFTIAITTLAVKLVADDSPAPVFDRNFAVGQATERNSNGERSIDVYFRKSAAKQ